MPRAYRSAALSYPGGSPPTRRRHARLYAPANIGRQTNRAVTLMDTNAFLNLDILIDVSRCLHQTMLDEGATTPDAVAAILDREAPSFTADERRAVMRLAASTARYVACALDEAMLTAMDGAQWTHTIAAIAVQDKWVSYDLEVCLGDHPDDPEKAEIRDTEVEYLRSSVAGVHANTFGRLFREQLARPAMPELQDDL